MTFDKIRLESIIANFTGKKVLVLGDLMLDEYLIGQVTRISPEAPVPVVEVKEQVIRFGGAANVALNILTLGCEPILAGVVGEDREADLFRSLMAEQKMSPDGLLKINSRPTTVKTRVIGHSQHITRVDRESKVYLDAEEQKKLMDLVREQVPRVDAVILQDYNKGVLTPEIIEFTISLANKNGKLITVDPKFINFMNFRDVTLFKPNIKETEEALAIKISDENDLLEAGKRLLKELRAKSVLITRGGEGMSLFEESGMVMHVPTKARKIADVSGAGDTVISTLTAALMGGADYREAATMANYAAGIVCEEVGIVPIERDKLIKVCIG